MCTLLLLVFEQVRFDRQADHAGLSSTVWLCLGFVAVFL